MELGGPVPTVLEREGEMERIAATLATVADGEGAVLPIEGPAGAGKSALVRAAAIAAEGLDFEVLRATGREMEGGFAFGVVTQLFAPLLATMDDAERDSVFAGAAELARPLFEGTAEPPENGETFPRLHGLHWLCVNLSSRRPLLLLIDDAHWADRSSLAFLTYLAPRVEELELCLVLAIRSGETEGGTRLAEALSRLGIRPLQPSPLSERAVAKLVGDRLGADAGEAVIEECVRATGGNPLFVRELLRSLRERADSAIDPSGVAQVAPPSVGRIVLDRVEAMGPQEGRVVRAIAVLGDGADSRLIARLTGIGLEEIAASIDRLIETGLLDGDELVSFEHPIVRQAIYESIAPATRSYDHLEAARALAEDPGASERAAAHLLAADPSIGAAGESGVEALIKAARRANARGAAEVGVEYLTRALAENLESDRRREVLLELGIAELRLGDEACLQHLQEAERLSADGPQRAEAALARSTAQTQMGAAAEAVATCDAALETVADVRELRLALEGQRAHSSWLAGTLTGSGREHLYALEDEVAAGSTPAERGVLTALAVAAGVGATREAAEVSDLADRALADGRLLTERGAEHPTYMAACAAKTLAGNFSAALAEWSAGIEHSRRRGSIYGYATALFSRAYTRHMAGDIPGAEADAVEGLALLPESELVTGPLSLATAANVAVERGAIAAGIEQGLELIAAEESPPVGTFHYATLAAGRLAHSRGDLELALARFRDAGRRADQIGWRSPASLPWRSAAAAALQELGRREEALELVDEEIEVAQAFGSPEALGIAQRTRAIVVGDEEGVELAREAVATLAGSEARLEHAKALIDLGSALRRSGESEPAREHLRAGMDLAHRCGSTRAVERALEELRASGARPRRPTHRGAASLSPQERQTTRLAAEGLNNRQIAEAMFITRRTVELHLTNAYRKLGISSRGELAEALEAETAA